MITAFPVPGRIRPALRARPARLIAFGLAAALAAGGALGVRSSLALFVDVEATTASFDSQEIFSDERVTPAFEVEDRSAAGPVDGSSALAFEADGRTVTTSTWSTAFASDRYLEFDLNAPLPDGLSVSSATFSLSFASATPAATACHYFEVRRASSGDVLATHGGPGSPVACVTGSTPVTSTTPIGSVDATDLANDLRLRVYGRDSAGGGTIVDRATVGGGASTLTFTLYPVLFVDAADTTAVATPWQLSSP